MKKIIVIMFCLAARFSYAQVIMDKTIKANFDKLIDSLDIQEQKDARYLDSLKKGILVFYDYGYDVLDTVKKTPVVQRYKSIEPDYIIEVTRQTSPCKATLNNDTLTIYISLSPGGPYSIYKIVNGAVTGTHKEYNLSRIFWTTLEGPAKSQIFVPENIISFKLTTLKFKRHRTIYGEITSKTAYFYRGTPGVIAWPPRYRLHYKCIFKAVITAPKKDDIEHMENYKLP